MNLLHPLTKREAEILTGFLSEEVTYRGSIHGIIHDIGIEELSFHLRHSRSGDLVRCDFPEVLYQDVHDVSARRHAVVYVHGLITTRRVDREITKVRVEKIKVAPPLAEDKYLAFFGADPNYSGELSSEDYVDRGRYAMSWTDPITERDPITEKALSLRHRGKTLQEIADELRLGRLDVFRILQRAGIIGSR